MTEKITTTWTDEECNLLTTSDLMEYFSDAVYEVTEVNGNKLTWKVIVDILMDFAVWPEGMTNKQIDSTAKRIAKEYVGK